MVPLMCTGAENQAEANDLDSITEKAKQPWGVNAHHKKHCRTSEDFERCSEFERRKASL